MRDNNWCRRTNWTRLEKEDFFTRLSHCRSQADGNAMVQAYTLLETDEETLIPEAVELFNYILEKWPDTFYLDTVYFGLAKCYENLNDVRKTIEYYHLIFELEEKKPNSITAAAEHFGLYVAQNKLTQYYGEVVSMLNKRQKHFVFPLSLFLVNASIALINADLGKNSLAKVFAEKAIEAANRTDSGFRHHKKVGLVGEKEKDIIVELKRLV